MMENFISRLCEVEQSFDGMRVVHLCNLPLPEGHPDRGRIVTHPGRWVLNLALAQRAHAGIDARLVVQVPGASRDYECEVEGVPVRFVAAPDRLRSTTLFFFDVRRLRRAVLDWEPDVVHAHGTEDAYALAAQACGRPSVITAQGCFFIINREMPAEGFFSRERIVEWTERMALRRAGYVIAKSGYVRGELARAFPHLRLHEIPNTFDPRLLEIPVDRLRRVGHLAFVGTVVERKGVHVIREAFGILRRERREVFEKCVLHIFGDRREAAEYEVRELAGLRELLGERLLVHGTVGSMELAEELSTIPVLLAPSLEEMFGNQFIEAELLGVRGIVAEGTAMAENARRIGSGVVVEQRDAAGLARAIAEALENPREVAEMEAVRGRILDFMGPAEVARRHGEVYEKLKSSKRKFLKAES
ncbi:MAG: glycosyltransferase family 4 protein [Terrimicrobiaceae bacterium]